LQAIQHTMANADVAITIKVQRLCGEVCCVDTRLGATLSDIKIEIQKQSGHAPGLQKLIFGEMQLPDANAILSELGIGADSMLTLVIQEPLGQSKLGKSHGKKEEILPAGYLDPFPREKLDEFQWMSWQAVCKAHDGAHPGCWAEWTEDVANMGHGEWTARRGADLHWTTRSDGCRYEYWSAALHQDYPEEYGVLVRIDANSMVAIGSGSDNGLEIFDSYAGGEVIAELVREGLPRWK